MRRCKVLEKETKLLKLKKEFQRKKRKGMSLEEFLRLSKRILELEKDGGAR